MHLSSLCWGLRRDNTRFPIPEGAGVRAAGCLPSISHSYWISHPESLGKWGKSLFFNLLLNLEFNHLSGKRNLPEADRWKENSLPGAWQERDLPHLYSPHWVLEFDLGGQLDYFGYDLWIWCFASGLPSLWNSKPIGFPLSVWQSLSSGLIPTGTNRQLKRGAWI